MKKIPVIIVILLLSSGFSAAKWAGWRGNIFLETGYDSNPAILSEEQMDEFDAGDPYYSIMDAIDDGYATIGGALQYRFRTGESRWEFGGDYRWTRYLYNETASYHYLRPNAEFWRGRLRGEVHAVIVLGYASSVYNDTDLPDEIPVWATYDAYRGGGEVRFEIIEDHWLGADLEYGYSRYNDNFPEYDGANLRAGVAWRWSGPVYIKLGYAYRVYDARAFDAEGESAENSDDTDISYAEDRIESYLSRSISLVKQDFLIGASINLSQRFYTSEKDFIDDYIHLARRDLRADFSPFLRWETSDKLEFTLSFDYTIRDSDSPYYNLDDSKDYDRYKIALKSEYFFR